MNNLWKLATMGIALTVVTALATGLTTAYMMRPALTADPQLTHAMPATIHQVARARVVPVAPTQRVIETSRPIPVNTVSAECATTGDRIWRIAKPGLLGGLLGAGVGAAGGAIADGGKGAGKGAAIGGLTGAAAGSIFGAYKTSKECGGILGGNRLSDGPTQTAFSESADQITVYNR